MCERRGKRTEKQARRESCGAMRVTVRLSRFLFLFFPFPSLSIHSFCILPRFLVSSPFTFFSSFLCSHSRASTRLCLCRLSRFFSSFLLFACPGLEPPHSSLRQRRSCGSSPGQHTLFSLHCISTRAPLVLTRCSLFVATTSIVWLFARYTHRSFSLSSIARPSERLASSLSHAR